MDTDFDAIIIGAGPAGSTAAILLARCGWRVALIEKHEFPRRKVCGECIAASNLPLLDALGIGGALQALAGPPLRHIAVMRGKRTIQAAFPAYAHPVHRWGVALSREYLDTLLLEQARRRGVSLFQPWVARQLEGAPGSFACHVFKVHAPENAVLQAPVVIDAHGSWEPAPIVSGTDSLLRPPHLPSDLFAFKANFAQAGLEPCLLPVLSFAGGYGGMVMGGGGIVTLAFCMRRDVLMRCREMVPGQHAADAAVAYVADACDGVRAMLSGAQRQGAWLSAGPIRPGLRLHTAGGRQAYLIGNAAGEAHPIIGEGMSMAIQSAWLLAERLAPYRKQLADRTWHAALRASYADGWQRYFLPRMRLAALCAHVAMRPVLAASALSALACWPPLLTHAARWSGKIRSAMPPGSSDAWLSEINNQTPRPSILQDRNQPRSY
jgi:2-polyprenyl-6-methoxyphenol hydroxylase-like FAD-dependent oxidoreductase